MRLAIKGVRRAVIVAPHPDDEIIGAAALIRTLRRQGSDVQVIIVSDGAASHPASVSWLRNRLIAARRRESGNALARLDVMRGNVTFLNLPDGGLPANFDRCRVQLRRVLSRLRGIDLIVGPSPHDAHPDHQAVAEALNRISITAPCWTYQVWPPLRHKQGRCRTIVMPGGAATKRSLIRAHRTQLGAIKDDPKGFAIAPHELTIFAHPVERFVVAG
ncbi:PIG-L deacetylase family protein [Sphingomonas sp. Marseille-Q8236]